MEKPGKGPSQRKHDFMKTGESSEDRLEKKRIQQIARLRQGREGRLRAKRLGNGAQAIQQDAIADTLVSEGELDLLKQRLALPVHRAEHLEALQRLQHVISTAGELAFDSDSEAQGRAQGVLQTILTFLPLLIADLMPKQDGESSRRACLEAATAINCLAEADQGNEFREKLMNSVPVLVAHLSGGLGVGTAEQCASALGLMAGAGREARHRLLQNMAVGPLARLMLQARSQSVGAEATAAAQAAAWALSQLVRDGGPEIREMVSLEGFRPHLQEVLRRFDAPGLLSEAAWVAAYATASQQCHLPAGQFLRPTLDILEYSFVGAPGIDAANKADVADTALLIPVLRCIGNLFATSSPQEVVAVLRGGEGFLSRLLQAARSGRHGVQKEALWALSNFSALHTPDRFSRAMLAAVGGDQEVAGILRSGTFPLRKEALICLRNHCSGDPTEILAYVGGSTRDVPMGILPAVSSLARSQDQEAAYQALCVLEAVLRGLPGEGAQMVESVEGIDIMEEQQMRGSEQCQSLATQLLETFYGNDYGWTDGAEVGQQ